MFQATLLAGAAIVGGCHAAPNRPVKSDLSSVLYVGMTDEEARHKLGLYGPVTGAGGLTWCWRTLQSPYFPGVDIELYERVGHDGSVHVTQWSVEPSRK